MRLVVQRVSSASVSVAGEVVAAIGRGMLVLVGVTHDDTVVTARRMAAKCAALRIFEDAEGRMNLGAADVEGDVLAVSQFTLYANVRRGNRPSFDQAAPAAGSEPVYEAFCRGIEAAGLRCARGRFGAEMQVHLVNDGPVTIIVDSADLERPRGA